MDRTENRYHRVGDRNIVGTDRGHGSGRVRAKQGYRQRKRGRFAEQGMMRHMRSFFTLLLITLVFLCGCRPSGQASRTLARKNKDLREDVRSLEEENVLLKKELEKVKYSAKSLLEEAIEFYESEDHEGAKKNLEILLVKHPLSKEAKRGKEILVRVKTLIEQRSVQNRVELGKALESMEIARDEIEGVTWYEDGDAVARQFINLYIEKKDAEKPELRLELRYIGNDWLFIESYVVWTDKERFVLEPVDVKREALGGGVVAELDNRPVTAQIEEMVRQIISSPETVLRYRGKRAFADRTITGEEKAAMRNVLDVYNLMKNSAVDTVDIPKTLK
ncbi:MAG: hypothetical protein U9R44_06440 [Candidatus Omnitrophota bacterium]|nr:hypothetical protein [Candidatus Omnitrophota bacterium]